MEMIVLDYHFVSDHFNYINNTNTLGESIPGTSNEYYIDYEVNRLFYPQIYPEYKDQWKFTPNDFSRLDNVDPSVNQIYSNGNFWINYVQNQNQTITH